MSGTDVDTLEKAPVLAGPTPSALAEPASTSLVPTGMDGGGTIVGVMDRANPFAAVAMLLATLATSLETARPSGGARRWVRIVRVREYLQPDNSAFIAKGVSQAVGALIEGVSYMQRFCLLAYDLLRQGDAVKALFEASADFIDQTADPAFINAITAAVDGPSVPTGDNPLAVIKTVTGEARKYVDKVPEPEDLEAIGRQLFRLLVVVQEAPEAGAPGGQIDLQLTGKLRLLQWGLGKSWTVRDVVSGKDCTLSRLGARRLAAPAKGTVLVALSRGEWSESPGPADVAFEFDFAANQYADLDEARDLLRTLGYSPGAAGAGFSADLVQAIEQFQVLNAIPQTGALDNVTLNRMMHLRFDPAKPLEGGLLRAIPFNDAKLKTASFKPRAKAA